MRHTGIKGTVRTKAGTSLAGAIITLTVTGKTATTDINGFYNLERMKPGDCEIQLITEGYAMQTKIQHIGNGRIK